MERKYIKIQSFKKLIELMRQHRRLYSIENRGALVGRKPIVYTYIASRDYSKAVRKYYKNLKLHNCSLYYIETEIIEDEV